VPARRTEPVWLSRLVVEAIHHDQLREHGGLPGVRDENLLESALARPQQKWHYDAASGMPALAAAYAFGLIKNHPFRDGNKRVGFLAMATFLGVNGHELEATDAEIVAEMLSVADGTASEDALAQWIDQHIVSAR
jgi:death-on-curing protein